MHVAELLAVRCRPLVIFCMTAGIAKAINIEYNTSRVSKAKALASWAAGEWPEQLGHLAEGRDRYIIHDAAFHEVSCNCSQQLCCSDCVCSAVRV